MNKTAKMLLTIGGAVAMGAILGMLFAPEDGVETRKKIMKRSKKLIGSVNNSLEDGKESLEEIKEVLQKQLVKVSRKIEEFNR